MKYETIEIDSSKIPWLQKALEEASVEKRELFYEYAFWILEGRSCSSNAARSRENVLFYLNRISGRFKYSCEKIVVESFISHDSIYQSLTDFLEFFYSADADRKKKVFSKELLPFLMSLKEKPLKPRNGLDDPFVALLKKNAERVLKDFFDERRQH